MHLIKTCISIAEKKSIYEELFIKLTLLLKTFFLCDVKDIFKMFSKYDYYSKLYY